MVANARLINIIIIGDSNDQRPVFGTGFCIFVVVKKKKKHGSGKVATTKHRQPLILWYQDVK